MQDVGGAHAEPADDQSSESQAPSGDPEGSRRARVEVPHQVPGLGSQQPEHGEAPQPGDEEGAPKVIERLGMRGEQEPDRDRHNAEERRGLEVALRREMRLEHASRHTATSSSAAIR